MGFSLLNSVITNCVEGARNEAIINVRIAAAMPFTSCGLCRAISATQSPSSMSAYASARVLRIVAWMTHLEKVLLEE